jgi:hypothetical protein
MNSTPVGKISGFAPLLDVVADHDDGVHALGAHLWAICGTVSVPSTGWPPVIATASL